MASRLPPFLDMPDHRLPRQALTKAFFSTFAAFSPAIDAIAKHHVDRLAPRVDLVRAAASPFACETMARFVGIDEPAEALKAVSSSFFQLFAPITDSSAFASVNKDLAKGRGIIGRSLQSRRRRRGSDLLSRLLDYQEGAPALSDDHIIDLAFLIVADGIENIEPAVALVFRRIVGDEGVYRRCLQPASIEPFVREALRLETPAQLIPRVARESFQLHDRSIPEGMPVFLALGSANRDPRVIAQAEAFDEEREDKAVTFGLGRHRCIGEPLAVAMIEALVRALLRRGASQSPADRRFVFQQRFGHRWPTSAMIDVPPA
jgi:cytochrome P450